MSDSTPFLDRYEQAKKRAATNKQDAIQKCRAALNRDYKLGVDQWENFYCAKISIGQWQREIGLLAESNKTLNEVIFEVSKHTIYEKIEDKNEVRKLRYSVFHNTAKSLIKIAQQTQITTNYEQYRQKMNESYKNFSQSLKIILQALNKENKCTKTTWWQNEYLKLKSNYMELLFQEAESFYDLTLFQAIVTETQKAEKFHSLCHHQEAEVHLFRCFYYKSISLRFLGRVEESLTLLKKDLKYQQKNNQPEDAKKTKQQILRTLIDKNNIKQAQLYLDSKLQSVLHEIQKSREIIKNSLTIYEALKYEGKDYFDYLFSDFNEGINQYRYDYEQMDRLLSQIVYLFEQKPEVQALIYYYLAEANYLLKNYEKALEMIKHTLSIKFEFDPFEYRDYLNENFKILTKCDVQQKLIQTQYKKLINNIEYQYRRQGDKSKKQMLEDQKNDLNRSYQEYQILTRQKKENICYYKSCQQEDNFLRQLQIKNGTSQKRFEPMEIQSQESVAPRQRLSKNIGFNPEEEYISRCSKSQSQKVYPREEVIKVLRQNAHFNPTSQIVNLSNSELNILVQSLSFDSLDLRYHFVNDELLRTMSNEQKIERVRQLKLNGTNFSLSSQMLMRLIENLPHLDYLSFLNFSTTRSSPFNLLKQRHEPQDRINETPQGLVHVLSLICIRANRFERDRLKVLKLKYCNLQDGHLLQVQLNNFNNLEEIGLSHNLLQGHTLKIIMNLPNITQLNFSDNPLVTLDFQNWKFRFQNMNFQINSLKLRNIQLVENIRNELNWIIERVRRIDLSQCMLISQLLSKLWSSNLMGEISLHILQEVKLLQVKLDNQSMQNLNDLLKKSSSLRLLDIRNCTYDRSQFQSLKYLLSYHPHLNIRTSKRTETSNFKLIKSDD